MKKKLEKTCDAKIGASIDRARRAEHKPGVVETAVTVGGRHKKGGNLNVPAAKESELLESNAELKNNAGNNAGKNNAGNRGKRHAGEWAVRLSA